MVDLEKSQAPTVISLQKLGPNEPVPAIDIDTSYDYSYQPKNWRMIYQNGFPDFKAAHFIEYNQLKDCVRN